MRRRGEKAAKAQKRARQAAPRATLWAMSACFTSPHTDSSTGTRLVFSSELALSKMYVQMSSAAPGEW